MLFRGIQMKNKTIGWIFIWMLILWVFFIGIWFISGFLDVILGIQNIIFEKTGYIILDYYWFFILWAIIGFIGVGYCANTDKND